MNSDSFARCGVGRGDFDRTPGSVPRRIETASLTRAAALNCARTSGTALVERTRKSGMVARSFAVAPACQDAQPRISTINISRQRARPIWRTAEWTLSPKSPPPTLHDSTAAATGRPLAIIDGPSTHASVPERRASDAGSSKRGSGIPRPLRTRTHVTECWSGKRTCAASPPTAPAIVYSIYRENADGELEPSSQPTLALAINGLSPMRRHHQHQQPASRQNWAGPAYSRRRRSRRQRRRRPDCGGGGNDGCRCLQVPAALDSTSPSVLAAERPPRSVSNFRRRLSR